MVCSRRQRPRLTFDRKGDWPGWLLLSPPPAPRSCLKAENSFPKQGPGKLGPPIKLQVLSCMTDAAPASARLPHNMAVAVAPQLTSSPLTASHSRRMPPRAPPLLPAPTAAARIGQQHVAQAVFQCLSIALLHMV